MTPRERMNRSFALCVILLVAILGLLIAMIVEGETRKECPPCPTLDEVRATLDGTRPKRPEGCSLEASGCPSIDDLLLRDVTNSFQKIEQYPK